MFIKCWEVSETVFTKSMQTLVVFTKSMLTLEVFFIIDSSLLPEVVVRVASPQFLETPSGL